MRACVDPIREIACTTQRVYSQVRNWILAQAIWFGLSAEKRKPTSIPNLVPVAPAVRGGTLRDCTLCASVDRVDDPDLAGVPSREEEESAYGRT